MPYKDLTLDLIHRELENMFATEFSASLGMSKRPPLKVMGDAGKAPRGQRAGKDREREEDNVGEEERMEPVGRVANE